MNASWTIKRVPEKGLLVVTTKGTVTIAESDQMIQEIFELKLDPEKYRILVDHRAAVTQFSSIELYELPQSYQIVESAARFWVATVFRQIRPDEEFYVRMCRTRGFNRIEVFDDYDKALAWLTSPDRR